MTTIEMAQEIAVGFGGEMVEANELEVRFTIEMNAVEDVIAEVACYEGLHVTHHGNGLVAIYIHLNY